MDETENNKDINEIKQIRTYKSDAEEAVKNNHTSVIDIAVAENKKKEETPIEYEKEKTSKKTLWFSIILIFIALAVVSGTYYFWIVGSETLSQTAPKGITYSALINANKTETIPVDQKNPASSIISDIENISSVPVGSIVDLIPVESNGIAVASSSDFFSTIGITIPTQVALALDGTYSLGTIVSSPNHPFVVLGVSSFENAFAGMFSWEKTMRSDFAKFIDIDHPDEPLVPVILGAFTDKTIGNQDVREFLNASSTPILLYTFVGTGKLVIATDADTLSTIITSLNTTNTAR